uniref:TFIIS central domain-containing protein n=1 Tax=Ditylenchus dipsaci TaxID=166011 RepID=A0A915EFG4_9BILA
MVKKLKSNSLGSSIGSKRKAEAADDGELYEGGRNGVVKAGDYESFGDERGDHADREKKERQELANTVQREFQKRRKVQRNADIGSGFVRPQVNTAKYTFLLSVDAKIADMTLEKRESFRRVLFDALQSNRISASSFEVEEKIDQLAGKVEQEIALTSKVLPAYRQKIVAKTKLIKEKTAKKELFSI